MPQRLFSQTFQPLHRMMPGQRIPSFRLPTPDGQVIDTEQFTGRRVLLAFLGDPSNPSGGRLLRQLQASQSSLQVWGGTVVAVAPMTVDLDEIPILPPDLAFPVGIDPGGALHDRFGAVDWSGLPGAALFLVDPSGTIIYRALAGLGESLPTTSTLITLLQFDQLAPSWLTEPRRPPDAAGRTLRAPEPPSPRSADPTAAGARRPAGSPRR